MSILDDTYLQGQEGALARTLYKSMGYTEEDLHKPMVAVINSYNGVCPGHYLLKQITEKVKDGIRIAGGTPVELTTIGPCDGMADGTTGMMYILPSRDLLVDNIEVMMAAHSLKAMVLVGSCDKAIPGMLMAAARLNIPTILVNGGPMLPGIFKGEQIDVNFVEECVGRLQAGTLSEQMFKKLEEIAGPTPGSCAMLGTANTMACLAEAMGMMLPGSAVIPSVFSARLRIAQETGKQILFLVKHKIKSLDIINMKSIENAIIVGMAIGGSTNLVLHLLALANEAGCDLDLEKFDELSKKTPQIASIMPLSPYTMLDFYQAGGLPFVIKQLMELLHKDVQTVTGKSLCKTYSNIDIDREFIQTKVVTSLDKPFNETGGLAVLRGNLAPMGSIARTIGMPSHLFKFSGYAKVFNSEESLFKHLKMGKIKERDIIIVRYEGPKGGPGMREIYKPLKILEGLNLIDKVALITDGRFSGSNTGCIVGHVCPEAADGGPIAIVEDGDEISIDILERKLNVNLSIDDIKKRLKKWKIPDQNKTNSKFLNYYKKRVESAYKGAVMK